MSTFRIAVALSVFAFATSPASAQSTTVESLVAQDFAVVGSVMTKEGAGLFLQKKDKVFFCVVAERKGSVDVFTRYCKPVR